MVSDRPYQSLTLSQAWVHWQVHYQNQRARGRQERRSVCFRQCQECPNNEAKGGAHSHIMTTLAKLVKILEGNDEEEEGVVGIGTIAQEPSSSRAHGCFGLITLTENAIQTSLDHRAKKGIRVEFAESNRSNEGAR